MRRPPRWLFPLVATLILACTAVVEEAREGAAGTRAEAPRPTVNHRAHLERDLICSDCHDPEETGTPAIPRPETCFECHEDLSEEPARVQAYFRAARRPDGSYRFARPPYGRDLQANHKGHAAKDVACRACHGTPSEAPFARPEPLAFMQTCLACHEQRGAPVDCAVCHKQTRKDRPPPDHDDAWRFRHGKTLPGDWREAAGKLSCALCHEVPRDCTACHRETKPRSHSRAGFRLHHGLGDTDALEAPFAETSCSLCHEEQACVRCHQTTKPRSHTPSFERRLHGITASIERQDCRTCHQQDFCTRCHETVQPITHRPGFLSGRQAHCLGCHEPLSSSSCSACHKDTLGHLQAPERPGDGVHATATTCTPCHTVLPHYDDGGDCRRCHR